MELIINGKAVSITHRPITLRNAESLSGWAKRMREHVMARNKGDQRRLFVDLFNKHPELLDVMTMQGELNPQAVIDYIERDRKGIEQANANLEEGQEPLVFNEEQSRRDAVAWVQKTIGDMMKDTPSIARILQYMMPQYGTDLESLKLGIECVRATCDTKNMDEETVKALSEDEAWQDVDAVEVAEYVSNFLAAVS